MEISLIENIQRENLNPIEEAAAYKRLMEITGLSQDEVAARVGKNRATVANTLRLLRLPVAITGALKTGSISPGHGRAILSLQDPQAQDQLFRAITAGGLSVRKAEELAARLNKRPVETPEQEGDAPGPGKKAPRRDPELDALEQRFIDALGTKVNIAGDLSRGSIRIDYYTMDDLERLLEIITGKN
jgi:ParB family chromosome partitioning protein